MDLRISDIIKYNTDIKIAGNAVDIRHYKEKGQLKGYSVDATEKESIQAKYERIIEGVKEQGAEATVIKQLEESMVQTIRLNKMENFRKSNRRARDTVLDLVSCNHDLFTDYDGEDATLKFLTLSFDPKQFDSPFEEYKTVYKENKNGQKYAVEVPKHKHGFRDMLTDYKFCYGEITKFFKRLSNHLYDINTNVIKYICVPELHKNDRAFHFHIIMFNMPYLAHADYMDIWTWGGVYIERVPNGSAGSVAKYVAKYLSKSQEDKNASYEQYERLGLENMKRYSCSRGLKRPIKKSATMKQNEIEKMIKGYIEKDWLEIVNKEGDKFRRVEVKGAKIYDDSGKEVGRGDMVYYTFRMKDERALNALKLYADILQRQNMYKKQEKMHNLLDRYKNMVQYDKNYRWGTRFKPKLNKKYSIRKNQIRTFDYYRNQWHIKPVII